MKKKYEYMNHCQNNKTDTEINILSHTIPKQDFDYKHIGSYILFDEI